MTVKWAHHEYEMDFDSPGKLSPFKAPPTWPPSSDFPITINRNGIVVSRYADAIWNLAPWANQVLTLNFGDGIPRRGTTQSIDSRNADIFRRITAWWIWGARAAPSAFTLRADFYCLRPLFILCTKERIAASDLWRFPTVSDKLANVIPPSHHKRVLGILHMLYDQRDLLGFTLLDTEALRRFSTSSPEHEKRQMAYIPPRIWTYQINRLQTFLKEFQDHREQLEACFNFCLKAYESNYGSLSVACLNNDRKKQLNCLPFSAPSGSPRLRKDGKKYYGHFSETAKKFGIEQLLNRWSISNHQTLDDRGIIKLAGYFTLATRVSIAYILNFSMMRISEAWALRSDCLEIENDENFGPLYILKGRTTKTVVDDDARWVTSPSVKIAIDTASLIARLRISVAKACPEIPITDEDILNPALVQRSYEPWTATNAKNHDSSILPLYPSYLAMIDFGPKLFDLDQLKITEQDLQYAKLVTPTLDSQTYAVGNIWPFSWHQLRRTGAVNMQASGLVSDASVQYQLKHATRAMSLYYGQGYSHVRMNNSARLEYIRAMYDILSKEILHLFTNRFVSPYGGDHKANILEIIDPTDSKKLLAAASAGKISWRETLLGGCTKRGPCEYGGIDNIARCAGGDGFAPCSDALFDRQREAAMRKLSLVVQSRLRVAPHGSPYFDSLNAQLRSIENAINVISRK